MKTLKTNYYVGVLLSASRNTLNRMQFAAVEHEDGSWSLYSRIKNFNKRFDIRTMHHVGDYQSLRKIASAINLAKSRMKETGLSVPGVELFTLTDSE